MRFDDIDFCSKLNLGTDFTSHLIVPQIYEMTKRIAEEKDKYIIEQCISLNIDPNILVNQLKEIHRLNDVIDTLEKALDKACELLEEAVCQDCAIFDEVIEENYMFITEKEEWKEWLMKDVD